MTDNLEQVEKDWPERRPKPISAQANVNMMLAVAILCSVNAALAGFDRVFHPSHKWVLDVIGLILVILIPWLGAIVAYRRMKKVIASGSSPDILLYLRYNGFLMLTAVFSAMQLLMLLIPRSG